MTNQLIAKTQCPKCQSKGADRASDNLALYSNASAHCFACGYHIRDAKALALYSKYYLEVPRVLAPSEARCPKETTLKDISNLMYTSWRGVSEETMGVYGVRTDGDTIIYPYGEHFRKLRNKQEKKFWAEGLSEEAVPLFGMDKFQGGQGTTVAITEGELDALSAYQMMGGRYAVVSIRGAQSAAKDVGKALPWLEGFQKVILALDNDEPGQKATQAIAEVLGARVHFARFDLHKDANEYLQANETKAFQAAWWGAKPYRPKNVEADYAVAENIFKQEDAKAVASYPFPTLQEMTYGIRTGELVLLTAQQKMGKTEFLRAVEHHLLQSTDANIGCIHLEEKEKRFLQGIAGYELGLPCHLPDAGISLEDQMAAYKKATKRDGRLHWYAHFGTDDLTVILDNVRFMATAGECKFIFLDNLTMLVNSQQDEDERSKIDSITKSLVQLCLDLDICIFLVAHVNDNEQVFGSRMPAKLCNTHIYLKRDKESADPLVRNQLHLMVRDNRFAGHTGPAGVLQFDPETYRLSELTVDKAIELNLSKAVV